MDQLLQFQQQMTLSLMRGLLMRQFFLITMMIWMCSCETNDSKLNADPEAVSYIVQLLDQLQVEGLIAGLTVEDKTIFATWLLDEAPLSANLVSYSGSYDEVANGKMKRDEFDRHVVEGLFLYTDYYLRSSAAVPLKIGEQVSEGGL